MLGFILTGSAIYALALPKARRDGWIVFVPDSVLILCITSHTDSWAAHALHERLFPTPPPPQTVVVVPAGPGAAIVPFGSLAPAAGPAPPPAQREPGTLWSWQWRWLAWRMGSTSLEHPRRWGSDVHDTLLMKIPSPWDESAYGPLQRAFARGDADLRGEAARKMRHIVQDTTRESLRKRFVALVHGALKEAGPPLDETLIRVLDLPWPEMREAVSLLAAQCALDPLDNRRIAATRSLAEIGPFASDAAEPLLQGLPLGRPDLPLYFLSLEAVLRIDPGHERAQAIVLRYLRDRSIYIGYRIEAASLWRFAEGELEVIVPFWREVMSEHSNLAGEAAKQMAAYPRSSGDVTVLLQAMADGEVGGGLSALPLLHERGMLAPEHSPLIEHIIGNRNIPELKAILDELRAHPD